VQWGLSLPRKEFCEADSVLHQAREDMRARQTYEALCVLYVAMTRAKLALYCVAAEGRNEKNAGKWLEQTYPGEEPLRREVGDARWFHAYAPIESQDSSASLTKSLPPPESTSALSPSKQKSVPIGSILSAGPARQLGNDVHSVLARLEWLGDEPDMDGVSEAAAARVRKFLGSDQARVLQKPEGSTLLWRERAFEVEIEGEFIGGIFDRVHVSLDKDQKPTRALILDFKTGPGDYSIQLNAYKSAAAKLLGLSEDYIKAQVLVV
jgi:hypothetical protein